tara:strand:- start:422 stop:1321 length:900 start_codon:yes stop_codon:yes gene_type:complete
MGNRRIGNRRLEAALDNLLGSTTLNGLNGSPFSIRNPDRIYVEEFFEQKPAINADLDSGGTTTTAAELVKVLIANKNFEVLGVNHSTDDVTHDAVTGMIKMETDGSDQDALSLWPHQDTNQTKWAVAGMWGSENQVECEIQLRTGTAITAQTIYAGLKLTDDSGNNHAYATDSDQVCFWFSTDDTEGAFTTNANLHCIVSSAGTDYISDLGIALAADTNYRLGITIDSDRKPSAWVDGVQYSLTSDSTAGGVDTGKGTVLGPALADNKDLYPTAGIAARGGAAKHMYVGSIKCSRIAFE